MPTEPKPENDTAPRADTQYCQQASAKYEEQLDEAGGDPRSASGFQALKDQTRTGGGWAPTLDARDARVTLPEEAEKH
jgi:hypothetical protein